MLYMGGVSRRFARPILENDMSEEANIEYIAPLGRAWRRMGAILFKPFDLGKWLALGFTAWLATLGQGGGGGGSSLNFGDGQSFSRAGGEYGELAAIWNEHGVLIVLVGVAVLLLIVLVSIALTWLRSRGRFMFLDNVIEDRALIKEPWSRFKREGNTLFVWSVCFGLLLTFLVILLLGMGALCVYPYLGSGTGAPLAVVGIGGVFLAALLLIVASSYIYTFLNDFVVPIMRAEQLTVLPAWSRFNRLFRSRPGAFILYGLFRFGLDIVVGMAILAVVIATCCLASCLLAIPYIGTVLLLPVLVLYRGLGPEFLAQFDQCWALPPCGGEEKELTPPSATE